MRCPRFWGSWLPKRYVAVQNAALFEDVCTALIRQAQIQGALDIFLLISDHDDKPFVDSFNIKSILIFDLFEQPPRVDSSICEAITISLDRWGLQIQVRYVLGLPRKLNFLF